MQAEDLLLHDGRHRDVIEERSEHHPYILISELLLALLVETINLCDPSGLVVASGEMHAFGVSHLQGHQQRDSLDRVIPSVHEISHEEVVGERRVASNGEEFNQVMQLSVDVSADGDRGSDWHGVGLL
jgi:hypothetical protein